MAAIDPVPRSEDQDIELLTAGELEIAGRLAEASNATLYCVISHGDREAACVYKPVAGERPLWDFP
ncbi:MAG: SCO1664 family protein, partial [Streptosporangiaceae bacterium]